MCDMKEPVAGMMIQKALHRIRHHDCLDTRFMFYSFLHMGVNGQFSPQFTGPTIKHRPRQNLAKIEIDFPPRPAQERLAVFLSAYDDLIDNNRRRMALLEDAARQLYREWFVRLSFPGHEHTRMIDGVPKRWELKKLGEVITLKRGYDLPEADRIPGDVPIVSSSGITGLHSEKKADARVIVTGRYGTLGQVYQRSPGGLDLLAA